MYQPVAIKHMCHEHTGVHTHAHSTSVSGPSCSFIQHVLGTSYTAVKGAERVFPEGACVVQEYQPQ